MNSTKSTLVFKKLEADSFAGINKDTKLLVVFDNPENRAIRFQGDQGTGKTSSLELIKACLGQGIPDNAVNSKDKGISASVSFQKDGVTYTPVLKNKVLTLWMQLTPGSSRSKLEEPATNLKKLIGNISTNPFELKALSGKKQVAWIRSLSAWSEEQQKKEEKLLSDKKAKFDERTQLNKEVTALKNALLASTYFVWEEENKDLSETKLLRDTIALMAKTTTDEKELIEKHKAAQEKKNTYEKCETRLATLKDIAVDLQTEIIELEFKLHAVKEKLAATDTSIATGAEWIDANKNTIADFDLVQQEVFSFSRTQQTKEGLASASAAYKRYQVAIEEQKDMNAALDKFSNDLKELIAEFTPKVDGLEVVVGGAIDNPKEEGLYFRDKPMNQLSESETIEMFVPLITTQDIRVMIIENMSSYGSKAIEMLNRFITEFGGWVYYSLMDRELDKMKVVISDKI